MDFMDIKPIEYWCYQRTSWHWNGSDAMQIRVVLSERVAAARRVYVCLFVCDFKSEDVHLLDVHVYVMLSSRMD